MKILWIIKIYTLEFNYHFKKAHLEMNCIKQRLAKIGGKYVKPLYCLGIFNFNTSMRNFNKRIFAISTIVFGLLLIMSLITAFGKDEGTLGTNIIWVTFSKLFYILRFPTHTLFWPSIANRGAGIFFGGLIINTLF
jgi:hypothetical protein